MKNWLFVLFLVLILGIPIIGFITKDPYSIIFGVLVGVGILFEILGLAIEKIFPKSKLAKKFRNVPEWLLDNVQL